jgi:hypothetical protein
MKRPLLAWLAILVPLWCVLVIGTLWEPIMRDGWGHWMFHRHVGLSPGSLYDFAKGSYFHNNPRLGQVLTMLVYTPGPYHSIVTPLVEISVFYLLAALVLGRWPSWRRTDDALLLATLIAMNLVCIRSLGPMLFYRPFTGNYVFGFALNLLWLIPYRFGTKSSWWLVLPMLVLGVLAGLSNEHTAPAFAVAGLAGIVAMYRRGDKFVPWAIAGLVGLLAGFVALLKAPGQDVRYSGLATQQSLLERISERGLHDNGKILLLFVIYMLPTIVWIILALTNRERSKGEPRPRERVYAELAGLGAAVLIVLTLLASPKQGDRLYFAPICLTSAVIAGWVTASLGRVQRIIAVLGAVGVIAVVGIRLLVVYHTAHVEFRDRMATIENAAPGSTVTVPMYSQKRSRWILGDDFSTAWLRANLAAEFNLAAIELRENATPAPQRVETAVPPPVPDEP